MAKLWTAADKENTASMPSWLLNSPFGDDGTIRQVLLANAKNNSLTTSVSSILGALAIIALINRIDRRRALIFSFAFLSLALVPSILIFIIASNFITTSIEGWFKPQVEKPLDQALEVAQTYYQTL